MKEVYNQLRNSSLIRFIIVGGGCTIVDFVVYMFFSSYISIAISKSISMMLSSILSYIINKRWTFNDDKKTDVAHILRYYLVFICNVVTNITINSVMYSFTKQKIIAFVVATGSATVINYCLQKTIVFKKGI